jgi:hypothetical protein
MHKEAVLGIANLSADKRVLGKINCNNPLLTFKPLL